MNNIQAVIENFIYRWVGPVGVTDEDVQRFNQFVSKIPPELRTAKSPLYRAVIVEESLIIKVLQDKKPLIPHERLFISWTDSQSAVEYFSKKLADDIFRDQGIVILQHSFPSSEIVLNIMKAAELYKIDSNLKLIRREKEVIVRGNVTTEFSKEDIYRVYVTPYGWLSHIWALEWAQDPKKLDE